MLRCICRSVLGIGDAGSATEDPAGGRSDAGSTATTYRSADRRTETGAEQRAAESLGIRLALNRGDLLLGVLPARLIIVIALVVRAAVRSGLPRSLDVPMLGRPEHV